MSWIEIWDGLRESTRPHPAFAGRLTSGSLVFEVTLPASTRESFVVWQGRSGDASALQIWRTRTGSIVLRHGDVGAETRDQFVEAGDLLSVKYSWDATNRTSLIEFTNCVHNTVHRGCVGPPVPLRAETVLPGSDFDMCNHHFAGVADHALRSMTISGFGPGTPIETPDGPRPIELLQPGMRVCTGGNGVQTVRWVSRQEVLARGQNVPVQLRAPYHGVPTDVIVTRSQRILFTGPDIEYLFGQEAVFARAGDLINGKSARLDQRRSTQVIHQIMLDAHETVLVGRCRMETVLLGELVASEGRTNLALSKVDQETAYQTLDRAAAQAMMAQMIEHRRISA
jgi:hypothetical protein